MNLRKTFIKIIFYFLVILISILIFLAVFEEYKRFSYKTPYKGEKFKVKGTYTHALIKRGNGNSVVFESGLDPSGHLFWYKIFDKLDGFNLIAYDRKGYMWSDKSADKRTLDNITSELKELLEVSNIPKPYILVGHSMGGLVLINFSYKYPHLVKGLVLVDSSHPNQFVSMKEELGIIDKLPNIFYQKFLARIGIIRKYIPRFYQNIDKIILDEIENNYYKGLDTYNKENKNFYNMLEKVGKIDNIHNKKLIVLVGSKKNRYFYLPKEKQEKAHEIWEKLQKDYLRLSNNNEYIESNISGHNIQIDDPDLIIDSIKKIANDK